MHKWTNHIGVFSSRTPTARVGLRRQGRRGQLEGMEVYSRDWSMRSCLRTLVWLVSLISPARNISSTTVYTFNGRHRKHTQGRK